MKNTSEKETNAGEQIANITNSWKIIIPYKTFHRFFNEPHGFIVNSSQALVAQANKRTRDQGTKRCKPSKPLSDAGQVSVHSVRPQM